MQQRLADSVGVLAVFSARPGGAVRVIPQAMQWQGRRWLIDKMGFYHPGRRGAKRYHIFSFASGETAFRVELDPDTLVWTLTDVFYG